MPDTAETRVIGYFAVDGDRLVLDQGACVVTGSESTMTKVLAGLPETEKLTLAGQPLLFRPRKIRFGAIVDGMSRGGSYAFDEEAYARFRNVANERGFVLPEETFVDEGDGIALLNLKLDF
ncbi:MAG: hypothetical protein KTR32_20840 [Granulosicoccus sp.]|nr:hypothetical protein [Granulosicoccus sp.]